ncbi:MAG: ribonuclease T [Pacificimonas sp.]
MRNAAILLAIILGACDPSVPLVEPEQGDGTFISGKNCRIPADLAPPTEPTPPDNIPDAPTAGYVVALSWSPEFCRFRGEEERHRGQCQDNRFGFILHGLWPQAAEGAHPRSCALAEPVSLDLMRQNFCMMPSAYLLQHEWAAHGTCQWDSPEAYYEQSAELWEAIERPDLFALSRTQNLNAGMIRSSFVIANADLPPSAVGVDLDNNGWLEEVFICLDVDFSPRPCDPREYGAPDERAASIWRGGR